MNVGSHRRVIVAVSAGVFIGTYDVAAISVALPKVVQIWHVSPADMALLGSSAFIGMMLGSMVAGFAADYVGRRLILLVDFLAYGIASVLSAVSPNLMWLILSRMIVGLAVGAEYAVVFPYLVEYIGQRDRGRIMAWALWAANFGMLFAYGLGALTINYPGGWRIPLAFGALLVVPILWWRRFLPESLEWASHRASSWRDVIHILSVPQYRNIVSVSALTWLSYQVSDQGLTIFLPWMFVSIFGTSISLAAWHSVIVKAVTIPAALITVWMIDRVGRRPLQLWGFWGRAAALLLLGTLLLAIHGNIGHHQNLVGVAWVLLVLAYAAGAVGPDKTTVITTAERMPTEIRASAQAIAESSGRLGGIVGVLGYSFLSALWGPGAGLIFFGAMAAIGTILTWSFLPETQHIAIYAYQENSRCREGQRVRVKKSAKRP